MGKTPALVAALVLSAVSPARAQQMGAPDAPRAAELDGVRVTERLGEQLPLEVTFVDQRGRRVTLGDLFDGERPVVLLFGYHRCPVFCDLVLRGALSALARTDGVPGDDYRLVAISIDPRDDPESARRTLASFAGDFPVIGEGRGLHFLTSPDEAAPRAAARAAGFGYTYDAREEQYGHPAVVMVATPDGEMARYLYGTSPAPADLELGLLEAARGRSLSAVDRVLLYCYRYDPQGGRYRVVAENIMKLFGAATLGVLGTFFFFMWRRELRRRRPGDRAARAPPRSGRSD